MSKRNLLLLISVVILFLIGTYMQATVYNTPVTVTGPLDASGSSRSAPAKVTTSSPGTCTIGDVIFRSDATAGQNLFYCTTTNNFTQQLNSGTATGGGITMYSATGLTVTANTYYIPIGGGGSLSTTETNVDIDAPAAATITNMYVQLSVALGGGNSGVFTMRKNAASQSVTCTVSGASATNCSDTTHSFAVSQGDLLTIQLVTTGTIVVTPNILIAAQFGNITATGTVNTGTMGQIAYFAANGTAVSGETTIPYSALPATTCASTNTGPMPCLESHTASGGATVDFTTCVSSTYDTYKLIFINVLPSTNGATLWLRMNNDAGANYSWATFVARAGPASAADGNTGDVSFPLSENGLNTAGSVGANADFTLYDLPSTTAHKALSGTLFYRDNEGTPRDLAAFYSGQYLSTSAVTSLRVLFSSGNVASGTIRCYGLAK